MELLTKYSVLKIHLGATTMKAFRYAAVAIVLVSLLASSLSAAEVKPPEGFTALFNGENVEGWPFGAWQRSRGTAATG